MKFDTKNELGIVLCAATVSAHLTEKLLDALRDGCEQAELAKKRKKEIESLMVDNEQLVRQRDHLIIERDNLQERVAAQYKELSRAAGEIADMSRDINLLNELNESYAAENMKFARYLEKNGIDTLTGEKLPFTV